MIIASIKLIDWDIPGHALHPSADESEKMASQGSRSVSSGTGVVQKPRTTTVSVDDYETWVEAKRYTVYKVVVVLPGRAYFIFRRSVALFVHRWGYTYCVVYLPPLPPHTMLLHRYNEFHDLYEKLRKAFPSEVSGMKFPGKRIIGNNFDPDFIKLRREALHDFTIRLMKVC